MITGRRLFPSAVSSSRAEPRDLYQQTVRPKKHRLRETFEPPSPQPSPTGRGRKQRLIRVHRIGNNTAEPTARIAETVPEQSTEPAEYGLIKRRRSLWFFIPFATIFGVVLGEAANPVMLIPYGVFMTV